MERGPSLRNLPPSFFFFFPFSPPLPPPSSTVGKKLPLTPTRASQRHAGIRRQKREIIISLIQEIQLNNHTRVPLEVVWVGTCAVYIKPFLDPVSRYIAGTHLHRGLLRLVCIKGTDQSILSPAPSKKIRYTEIDAFHRHHGPMARAACGGRDAVVRP